MGDVGFAGEEAQEWAARERAVLADGAAERGVTRFESVEEGALGGLAVDFDEDFGVAGESGQGAQVVRKLDPD